MTKTKKATAITELELVDIVTKRMEYELAKRNLRALEAEVEQLEEAVMGRIRAGAGVKGGLTAVIDSVTGSCRPKWREIHTDHMLEVHGVNEAVTEQDARKEYPPEPKDVLVIGKKP